MIETHLGKQSLKAHASLCAAAAMALIFVDHQDPLIGPTPLDRPMSKVVLQCCRFAMLQHLLRSGLPNIHDRQTVLMVRLNLGRY